MKLDCGILPRMLVLEIYMVSQKGLDKALGESKQKNQPNPTKYANTHSLDLKQSYNVENSSLANLTMLTIRYQSLDFLYLTHRGHLLNSGGSETKTLI